MEDSFIETGVDKLVLLVESKKKIALDEAAKALGVSVTTIEEWVDFLEEEGIITVEYSLTNTYLVARKLTEKDLDKKAKEFMGKKDSFLKKVEGAALSLERDTQGLDKLKEQFEDLQEHITHEVDKVKEKLVQLEKYERLKKGIDEQIASHQEEFKKRVAGVEKDISQGEKRFQEIIENLQLSKVKLQEERLHAESIHEKEQKIHEKLDLLESMIKGIREELKEEDKETKKTKEHIEDLQELAEDARKDVSSKSSALKDLISEGEEQKKNIFKMQEEVLDAIRRSKDSCGKEDFRQSKEIIEQFENFFKKKSDINNLLEKLLHDRNEMEKELIELAKKAKAFELASKSGNLKGHVAELEKHFHDLEKNRGMFSKEIERLRSLLP